jgi:hypothetical protein
MIFSQEAVDGLIVSAQQGYYQLRFVAVNKPSSVPAIKSETFFMPIVAWRISSEACTPITLDDAPAVVGEERATLVSATGNVLAPNGVRFKDIEGWAGEIYRTWRARWTEQQKQKVAA